jgi:hypothetical protein
MLNITVEDFQQFAVDGVEIATQDDPRLLLFSADYVYDLEKTFVPDFLGFATEKREINVVMDVADLIGVGLLLSYDADFLRLQFVFGELLRDAEELCVFPRAGRAVENHVAEPGITSY